mgnify:FL=1|tara:strand:+ start:206 stop:439 length:234 start_codon:yes stop_codon:yes gene_type:complete
MVGIIIKHGPHVVVVTAESAEEAEHIALDLLDSVGLDLEGEEVTMIVFDTEEKGGVILTVDDYSDMTGWSKDGYSSE